MQPIRKPTYEAGIDVAAPPSAVWAVLADPIEIPKWSPVCHRCDWIDGATRPEVGARFVGHNRLNGVRWSRECEVTVLEPERELGFSTSFKGQESTRWRYHIEAVGGGTRITEAYEVVLVPRWLRWLRRLPGAVAKSERDTAWNISTSLERLKSIVEADQLAPEGVEDAD